MEEIITEKKNHRNYLVYKIGKLRADIESLENNLATGDDKFFKFLGIKPLALENGDPSFLLEKRQPVRLSKLLELTAQTSGFKIETFSRILRSNPGEFYLYDCLLECRTSSLKFLVKFVETVQGSRDECGEISSMETEVIMPKGDPESLSDWIFECNNTGDLGMLVHGLVHFTELANKRRSILRSLYRRGKAGHLGSSSFSIDSEEGGVMVNGIGPKNVDLFSINWKIVYFPAMKSMKSTFEVNIHETDIQYESAEVFAALQRPFITEEDLPLLWDAIADAITS